ncbi:Na+/H+ antiporter NhaA [Pseudoclavibacter soli]|uniref:Na+/H+ antiporter NhaA n=1 Tax=Pseudoclavibacter soli TaxID=452623 RepID=UPI0003FD8664|nr:Na+/H+ antiporter NhaA [Pseudoclavibacter soli]
MSQHTPTPTPTPSRLRAAAPGLALIVAVIAALALANSPAASRVAAIESFDFAGLSLAHWVSDGLLVVFFLVVGIDLRRELTHGSLATPARAAVPVLAALGGMLAPAAVYLAFNLGPGGHPHGWAVPTATDIAFVVSLLALVAPGVSLAARAFVLALAVADDLFAIIVIAVGYSSGIALGWLGVAVLGLIGFVVLQRLGAVWAALDLLALPVAVLVWWATLRSGVHPTIAGVALGIAVRPDAASRILRIASPVATWLAVPLFAFVSASVSINADGLAGLTGDPVALGVFFGLVVGKPLGILAVVWLVSLVRPDARIASWADLTVVGLLAGVGFTVSLLVAGLAFDGQVLETDRATLAVFAASLVAALAAGAVHAGQRRRRVSSHSLSAR